jgi:hypothetical protein
MQNVAASFGQDVHYTRATLGTFLCLTSRIEKCGHLERKKENKQNKISLVKVYMAFK